MLIIPLGYSSVCPHPIPLPHLPLYHNNASFINDRHGYHSITTCDISYDTMWPYDMHCCVL